MYINLRYGDSEALMNFMEIDVKYWMLCDADSDKVQVIKGNNNKVIFIKDEEESEVTVEWEEEKLKVQQIWDKFEEVGFNYFPAADNLLGISVDVASTF